MFEHFVIPKVTFDKILSLGKILFNKAKKLSTRDDGKSFSAG